MRLSWLHLSDLHLRVELGWEQDVVLSSMLADIAARYSTTRRPDFLFVTGDIAYSGDAKQYVLAKTFLDHVRDAIAIDPGRVFVIPGNHDVDRNIAEDAFVGAQGALADEAAVDRFFHSRDRRATLFRRQAAFRAFAQAVTPGVQQTEDSFVHEQVVAVGPLRVRVLLIDSAWLSNGGDTDLGRLLVGERQIIEAGTRSGAKASFVTFALVHHPTAWLKQFEQVNVENLLLEHADLCLRGHVHAPDRRVVHANGHRVHLFTAGAAFETRTSDNTYLWCSVDLQRGEGTQVLHRYQPATRTWDATETPWTIEHDDGARPSLAELRETLPRGFRYASYLSCLLMGWRTEVPWASAQGEVIFASYATDFPGFESPVAETVRALQQHYRWRRAWGKESEWASALAVLARQMESRIDALRDANRAELDRTVASCAAMIEPGYDEPKSARGIEQLLAQVASLVRQGNQHTALLALSRWKRADFVTSDERRTIVRLEVEVQSLAGDFDAARLLVSELLAVPSPAPIDLALAARCEFDAGAASEARQFLLAALDAGVDVAAVRSLAYRISGALADTALAARVRP